MFEKYSENNCYIISSDIEYNDDNHNVEKTQILKYLSTMFNE